MDGAAQRVDVTASGMRFTPAEVTVKAGRWVVVEFTNDDQVVHDWMVDGIPNVDVPARPGQTARLRFVLGRHVWSCRSRHAEAGMVGMLIVEP
jgi:plastocyanin